MWALFFAAGVASAVGGTTTETAETATTADTGLDPDTDADGDGWTLGAGDCADDDPQVNPGRYDLCFDHVDNDCSSLIDEGCDNSARLASLSGGGACTGGGNIAGTQTALVLPLLVLGAAGLRRRRTA